MPTIGGHEFLRDEARMLDARAMMFSTATGVTPAMFTNTVSSGSQYAFATADAAGNDLDGAKTYTETRSELQTDQQFPSVSSQKQGIERNADGSVDLYCGPKAPVGK